MSTAALTAPVNTLSTGTAADTVAADEAGSRPAGSTAEARVDTPNTVPTGTPAGAPVDRRGFSIASFVLGLVSIVSGWTFFAPLTGLILGILALRAGTSERTLTIWGIAMNGAMLVLFVLASIAVMIAVAFGIFAIPFAA